jgi:phospholipase C
MLHRCLLLVALLTSCAVAINPKIQHFVVLMLENRAFDHMCGWMKKDNPDIDGLTGSEYNEYEGVKYYVNTTCPYVNPFDPDHGFDQVTEQLMGSKDWWIDPAPMSGFVQQAAHAGHSPIGNVMDGFSPERVPAITTLAKEFALFDKYFVSFPGETVINRLFFHMGHSDGATGTGPDDIEIIFGYNGTSIYDFFDKHGITWNAYYEDISDLLYMRSPRNLETLLERFRDFDAFLSDAKTGNLPKFSFISPRFYPDWGKAPRDQHPDHDVVEGERVIADVYAALRSSPNWNNTALLLTYDEHGGFADHVSPMWDVPDPLPLNNSWNSRPFNFTRNGMRVCTVLVSPWVQKGLVVHEANAPNGGGYEHTSIFNTLRNIWGFPNEPLSARQAWAAPYDHLLNLTAPRTDCPETLPIPTEHSEERAASVLAEIMEKKPNGLQREFYLIVEGLHGRDGSGFERFTSQRALGQHVRQEMAAFFAKKRAEKDSAKVKLN